MLFLSLFIGCGPTFLFHCILIVSQILVRPFFLSLPLCVTKFSQNRLQFFPFLLESRLQEAGYFHAISQSLKFTVQLLQIPEKVVISQIMQQIAELDPDMILLYTSTEIMKSLVQEVK